MHEDDRFGAKRSRVRRIPSECLSRVGRIEENPLGARDEPDRSRPLRGRYPIPVTDVSAVDADLLGPDRAMNPEELRSFACKFENAFRQLICGSTHRDEIEAEGSPEPSVSEQPPSERPARSCATDDPDRPTSLGPPLFKELPRCQSVPKGSKATSSPSRDRIGSVSGAFEFPCRLRDPRVHRTAVEAPRVANFRSQ